MKKIWWKKVDEKDYDVSGCHGSVRESRGSRRRNLQENGRQLGRKSHQVRKARTFCIIKIILVFWLKCFNFFLFISGPNLSRLVWTIRNSSNCSPLTLLHNDVGKHFKNKNKNKNMSNVKKFIQKYEKK